MEEFLNTENKWKYENGFYLTSSPSRIAKIISHWELFKKASNVPREIVECGVFKGASLVRLATFRKIKSLPFGKKIVGFDTFGEFPETNYENDKKKRENYINKAGSKSLSIDQLEKVLDNKNIGESVDLVKGNIRNTVPKYLERNPELRISLLHVDVDIYEPSVTIMQNLFEKVVEKGVVIFDDYGDFDGESKAVEENIKKRYNLQSMPCGVRGAYLMKCE